MAAVHKSNSTWALIIACGKSEQISPDVDSAFLQMGDQPLLAHSLIAFERCHDIDGIMVMAGKDRLDHVVGMARMYGTPKLKKIAVGAVQKTASIKAGLKALAEEQPSIVVIHEASQPCVSTAVVAETVKSAKRYGVAVAAEKVDAPIVDVPKGLKAGKVMPAGQSWMVHMPLAAKLEALEKSLGLTGSKAKVDDQAFLERICKGAHLVPVDRPNLRVRTLADIQIVHAAMRV